MVDLAYKHILYGIWLRIWWIPLNFRKVMFYKPKLITFAYILKQLNMSEEPEMISGKFTADETEIPRKKHDSLLKAAFEDCFAHLLRFFFKDADKLFDMGRGVDFVDKELLEITPDRLRFGGTRTTDMLARVYRVDGQEQWILLHLEIQGEGNERFSYRMFEYYYRAIDRFNKPVVAFAVFTGAAGQHQPSAYTCSVLGTEITYKYNTYQIFQHSDQELLDWDNPFALVVLAVKKSHLEKKIPDEELNEERSIIARRLIASGKYTKKQIEDFVLFLKNILFVKSEEINANFDQEIAELTGGQINMPGIIEAVALIYRDEAIEEGLREGLQKGIAQGIEQGIEQGRQKEALEIARNFKNLGVDISDISKGTRLSIKEIETL